MICNIHLICTLDQSVHSLGAAVVKVHLGLLVQVRHLGDHVDQLGLACSALGEECHLQDGEELGELLSSHRARGEHLLYLGDELGLTLLVEQLRGAGLHLGVDQSDGPLSDHLVPSVHLIEDADDGSSGVAPDQSHDRVLDDGDLSPVLRLEELHQNINDLGQVLDVLVLAQDGKVLNGL